MLFDDEEFDPYDNDGQTSTSAPEGLKEPHHSSLMVGHSVVEQNLIDLINSKKMPHAIIFSGEEGIGKFTMAQRLARAMLAHGIDDQSQDSLFGGDALKTSLKTLEVARDNPVFSKLSASLVTLPPLWLGM